MSYFNDISCKSIVIAKNKESDQVLLVLANKLGDFVKYIGGGEYAPILIPILEYLSNIEETCIRSAVAVSINKILQSLITTNMNSSTNNNTYRTQIQEYFEFFKRLCIDENNEIFYSRVTASDIIAEIYHINLQIDSTNKNVIKDIFFKLINDEIGLVRRAATYNLMKLCQFIDSELLITEFLQLMKKLINDDLSTIRVISSEILISYIKLIKFNNLIKNVSSELINLIHICNEDTSWRIRLGISKQYGELAECFDINVLNNDIFPAIIVFLSDVEPEIRINAIKAILPFFIINNSSNNNNSNSSSNHLNSQILPELTSVISNLLLTDPVSDVRKEMANLCIDLAIRISSEQLNNYLMDIILKIMSDEDPLVRLRIIQKLPVIAIELPNLLNKLIEYLKLCLTDINWRMRKGIALTIYSVIKTYDINYFIDNFLTSYLLLLKDPVDEVRLAAAESILSLVNTTHSNDFIYDYLYPTIKTMITDEYLIRINLISVINSLILSNDINEKFRSELVQLLIKASEDKVPNVRIKTVQVMNKIMKYSANNSTSTSSLCEMNEDSKKYLKLILSNLLNDTDKDVVYFTNVALGIIAEK